MKIFDCFMYFDEEIILDLRLNVLDKYVDYFVIVESSFTHKGDKRKLKFNKKKFDSFKDKIIYLTFDEEPQNVEEVLDDDYFIERKLYPNVDFYSGLLYKAMGFPTDMFTVIFAIGRLPGWIAQWKEMISDPKGRIGRPRQIYTGSQIREFTPIENRV